MLEKCAVIPNGIQIIDMPNSIVHIDLSRTVCNVLQYMRYMQKKQSYNSEITRKRDFEQVARVKKDLKYLNPTDLVFPEETWLFINHSLCPCYRDCGTNVKNYGSTKKIKNG